jgi:hypothetical protein
MTMALLWQRVPRISAAGTGRVFRLNVRCVLLAGQAKHLFLCAYHGSADFLDIGHVLQRRAFPGR